MKKFEDLTPAEQSKIELYRIRHGKYDEFLDSGEGILDEKEKVDLSNLDISDLNERDCLKQEVHDQNDQTETSLSSLYSKFIFNVGCLLALYRWKANIS